MYMCGSDYYFLFRTPVPTITDNEVRIERTGSNSLSLKLNTPGIIKESSRRLVRII